MFGCTVIGAAIHCTDMAGFPSPFNRGGTNEGLFDGYDEFVADHIPRPGSHLTDHDVLTGTDHLAFHRLTRELFEERKVYDMTFNYNLAQLNLDTRHPNAGYRYARDAADPSVLHAEFTPTTPFCPQTHTLTIGSFRAWNGLADRHEFDLVRVHAADMHHQSEAINEQLDTLAETYLETGSVEGDLDSIGANPLERSMDAETPSRGTSESPF